MIFRLRSYLWTLRYLSIRQLVFRPWRALRRCLPLGDRAGSETPDRRLVSLAVADIPVTWEGIERTDSGTQATFLNLVTQSAGFVDWSCMDHGLLWNYHLHYLNWLNQIDGGSSPLFQEYCENGHGVGSSMDPYPTSLRIINTVKAVAAGRVDSSPDARSLVRIDCRNLLGDLEYHIGANHLLENGFGVLWGGFFLKDEKVWQTGKTIVLTQMREQILRDGGHYERSPMYHAIVLWRLLDTINFLDGSDGSEGAAFAVARVLRRYATRMLGWLSQYPWAIDSGHMNDSAPYMAPTRADLLEYGRRLGITSESAPLSASGFRVLHGPGNLQVLVDAGTPGPRYQPGHAHAGTLGFELTRGDEAMLVDTGTSTYEQGPRRSYERSTRAHNTVSIGRCDSSEVWSSFRVARRARVTIHEDIPSRLSASHDGYRSRFGIVHTRSFDVSGDSIVITDRLTGRGANRLSGTATFGVAPGIEIHRISDRKFSIGEIGFRFDGAEVVRIETVSVTAGFNRLAATSALRIRFRDQLLTSIEAQMDRPS